MADNGKRLSGPRSIALVGPFASGKTTLLEAILARTGVLSRQGKTADGNTLGDSSAEARAHAMSVEVNIAEAEFMGDRYTFFDCPGSIEFQYESRPVLSAVDAAVVVAEADSKKIPALQVILRDLETRKVPHLLFLNKVDKTPGSVRDLLKILQPASALPLVLRQIPLRSGSTITGFIDLALERAHVYREGAESEIVPIPDGEKSREADARFAMLERVADFDDALLTELLEERNPENDRVFADLVREFREGLICPVFIGSAEHGNGILRLLKALRHEAPTIAETRERLGYDAAEGAAVQIMKTIHTSHGGKLSVGRVLAGEIADGAILTSADGTQGRVSGLFRLKGAEAIKRDKAGAGESVALGKLETGRTGDTLFLVPAKNPRNLAALEELPPVMWIAISPVERKDDVRLSAALTRLVEEDPSLGVRQIAATGETILSGQGEMHLRVAIEKLGSKYGIAVSTTPPQIGYRETIRKSVSQHGRHKKQSGGHGQFGDVYLDIKPLERGAGIQFAETVTGGAVPKQYFSSVEIGVRDYLNTAGPLGFPVVDVSVTLTDGSYHSVDSSDMAFRAAAQVAMKEGMPNCSPVLLEPVLDITVYCPSDATARINGIVSARRGQILGTDSREGWPGWDQVRALMPEAEVGDLIVELRSATAGVGSFIQKFDHLAELTGKLAEPVMLKYGRNAA
jgi:elongation factor G